MDPKTDESYNLARPLKIPMFKFNEEKKTVLNAHVKSTL
jgi:hypothetical protein